MHSAESLETNLQTILFLLIRGTFSLGRLLKSIKLFRPFMYQMFTAVCGTELSPAMYWNSLFGGEMLKNVWHSIQVDFNKTVRLGGKACNAPVINTDDKQCYRLLDFSRPGRPLVVNFGSLSCPIFMKKLHDYRRIVEEYKSVADFLIVYIEEAHPQDGWAFENNNKISYHRTQKERCSAAQILSTHNAPCPVLVDSMLDAANIAYGAMPIRLYVIRDDHVVYQGGAGPMGYKMDDVSEWLSINTRRKSN